RILARASEIANRLVRRIWNPDGAQLTRSRELGQAQAIAAVGLDPIARALRNQRRCNHLAVIAASRKLALQAVASGPGLIDHLHLSWRTVAREPLDELSHVMPDAAYQPRRRSTGLRHCHRDAVLVHIQSNEKLDTLIHGRSPCWLLTTRSQHVARRSSPRNLRRRRSAVALLRSDHIV